MVLSLWSAASWKKPVENDFSGSGPDGIIEK